MGLDWLIDELDLVKNSVVRNDLTDFYSCLLLRDLRSQAGGQQRKPEGLRLTNVCTKRGDKLLFH